ncbi:MAG: LysR family transcriptional regulator [Lachnospiraceae bacterium]|nr:LysR family transcriptional regulator [Lachnospiraceae bacterium]
MDFRALNTFIQIAEVGSFTRAAEKLGYAQPTVSLQIKQLESELGVQLFDRIGHTVSLTEGGREALSYAQRICHLSQEMVQGANKQYEPGGVIRLAMADSLCTPLIIKEFARFRRLYPKISLKVTTAGTDELFRLLDHNEVDLVCTLDNHIYNTTYIISNEEKIGVHFVSSASNPLCEQGTVDIHDLMTEPFLLTEKGMSYRRLLDEYLAHHSMEIQPVLEIGSADSICKLVEEDMGISFLPDYVTEASVKDGRLVRLPVKDMDVELWKQLLYHRDKWVSLQMEALIRHLSGILLG